MKTKDKISRIQVSERNKLMLNFHHPCKCGAIAAALLIGGQMFAWGTRCDISGLSSQVALNPEGADIQNIFWGNEADRKYSLFFQKKDLAEGKNRITFSFTPLKSGFISLNFNGCWAKRGGFQNQDKEITRISNIKVEGAELKNGNFAEKNSQGHPRFWVLGTDCAISEEGVEVWNLSGASQTIKVTADTKVTVSYTVEYVEFEPAES